MAARISSRSGRYCACRSSNGTFIWLLYPLGSGQSAARFDRRARLAVGLAAFDGLPLVVILLALGQADRHLHASVLEIQPDRYKRHALLDGLADQLLDLGTMEQEFPPTQRLVIGVATVAVGADVDVVEKDLSVLDARETVPQVDAAFADRFHLGAEQHQSRLERLHQMEIVERLAVFGDARLRFFPLGFFGHGSRSG